jgi:hypothetical protein
MEVNTLTGYVDGVHSLQCYVCALVNTQLSAYTKYTQKINNLYSYMFRQSSSIFREPHLKYVSFKTY